jgi:hypothetical protein
LTDPASRTARSDETSRDLDAPGHLELDHIREFDLWLQDQLVQPRRDRVDWNGLVPRKAELEILDVDGVAIRHDQGLDRGLELAGGSQVVKGPSQ